LRAIRGAPEDDDRVNSEIHSEAVMEHSGNALGGRDGANLEAVIERVERYTWRPLSSEFGDTLGGRYRASLEIHLRAVIERVWRCTGRP